MSISARRRLKFLLALMGFATIVVTLILTGLEKNISYFYKPSEIATLSVLPTAKIRVGGLVKAGSIAVMPDGEHRFVIEDETAVLEIRYHGLLPDLFVAGQGVIAQGLLTQEGYFRAHQLLAKHDENYRPPPLEGISAP